MRFYTIALLTGATAAAAGNTANLLLPGFQGHDLQAGIMGKVRNQNRMLYDVGYTFVLFAIAPL